MTCPSFCSTPGCDLSYGAHMSFGVSSAAMPTRGKAAQVINQREARWERDMPAYRRLRENGLQPPQIDGCHKLEAEAKVPEHVTMGRTDIKPIAYRAFEDTFGRKATEAA